VHAIATLKVLLTNAVYVTCRKFLKIANLANFSGEAIFPTLFQVSTIWLKNAPWKVDVLQYGDFNIRNGLETISSCLHINSLDIAMSIF
jgi:hypothetical protein